MFLLGARILVASTYVLEEFRITRCTCIAFTASATDIAAAVGSWVSNDCSLSLVVVSQAGRVLVPCDWLHRHPQRSLASRSVSSVVTSADRHRATSAFNRRGYRDQNTSGQEQNRCNQIYSHIDFCESLRNRTRDRMLNTTTTNLVLTED
jgi:hypothetical protein